VSSLIFTTTDDEAIVATDTLATSTDGQPHYFTTKAFVVPHLKLIMAGTGMAGFLDRWFIQANGRFAVRGIDHLDYHAANALSTLWTAYTKEFSVPVGLTTSVFHFGFSELTGKMHVYTYHSGTKFESRSVGLGIRAKPDFIPPDEYRFPEDVKILMDAQRTAQEKTPQGERLHIGGEIPIHVLTRQGCGIYTAARFDDFDTTEEAIYSRFL